MNRAQRMSVKRAKFAACEVPETSHMQHKSTPYGVIGQGNRRETSLITILGHRENQGVINKWQEIHASTSSSRL